MGWLLNLSEVSRRLEVDPDTVRLLVKRGLVSPKADECGHLFFDDVELNRLSLILSLKNDWGYSLAAMRNLFFEGVHHRTCELHRSM